FTQKADCEYGVQKIEVNWAAPDPPGRFYTLPYFPVIVAVAGVWAMTGLTLALKYYWKYTSSNPWTVDMGGEHDTSTGPSLIKASTNYSAMENAMLLYPLLESRWLAAVKILHTFGYTKVQLSLKPGQIDQEQTLLESQLKDIEGKISLLKCKIKTLAKEVTTNAQLSTARPMFAPDILLERLAILNLELVDLGQILGKYMLTKASITEEIAENTVKEYLVSATDGLIDLTAQGKSSYVHLQGESVCMDTPGSSVMVINSNEGEVNTGGVDISASGAKACISLETPSPDKCSQINISPTGILLAYGLPATVASIGLAPTGLTLSVGPPETGAMIEMTAGSILLKVGETEIALTPAGIVSKAPLIESSCEETKVSMGPQGISESVAEVSRSLTPAGHMMSAAEASLKVLTLGINANSPINKGNFEGPSNIGASMVQQMADGTMAQISNIININ
ncbi:MAG: hypothetical protein LW700_11730, partial [Gemmataceae bacterium]|nr:hypothetical protein [Gemmataceae bacterium]